MEALQDLIIEALGKLLPDRSPLLAASSALDTFLRSDRCFQLTVSVCRLTQGSPDVKVSAEPGPMPKECDVQLVLTAFNKSGPLSDLSPESVGVAFISPRPKIAAYAQMAFAALRDPSIRVDPAVKAAVEAELKAGGRFYAAVGTLRGEVRYWSGQSANPLSGEVTRVLMNADGQMNLVKNNPLTHEDSFSAMASLQDALSDLAQLAQNNPAHVTGRDLAHVAGLVSAELSQAMRDKLQATNPFRSRQAAAALEAAERQLAGWELALQSRLGLGSSPLTAPHMSLRGRIREVMEVIGSYDEVSDIVAAEGSQPLPREEAMGPFLREGVDAFDTGERPSALFAAALDSFRASLTRHAPAIRKLLNTVFVAQMKQVVGGGGAAAAASSQPLHVFRALGKIKQVLRQPEVAREAQGELDTLAQEIGRYLDHLLEELDRRESMVSDSVRPDPNRGGYSAPNTSARADAVAWAAGAEAKLRRAKEALGCLAAGQSRRASELVEAADKGEEKVRAFRGKMVRAWQEWTAQRLKELKPNERAAVYKFDRATGHVITGFSDQLVELLRDVRQMKSLESGCRPYQRDKEGEGRRGGNKSLGIKLDSATEKEIRNIEKFYRFGLQLKQIAHFYNHLADPHSAQIIPSQKPMLLDDARDLEALIAAPTDSAGQPLTWEKPQAMRGYLARLQAKVDELVEKNRRLRVWHQSLREKVHLLVNTDLVGQKDRWVNTIKEMREVFRGREAERFDAKSQNAWRLHWDHQLYKALQWQFTRGLEVLYEALPKKDVKAELREGRLQLDPPLEVLRRDLYDSIRAFTNLPLIMKGVSSQSDKNPGFFRGVFLDNSKAVAELYSQAEDLLARLERECGARRDWAALGCVEDLEGVIEATCTRVEDYELNLKALRAATSEIDKVVPPSVEVDCFRLNFGPFKEHVMRTVKAARESLIASLRARARSEKDEIASYLDQGKRLFASSAASLEQIGLSKQKAEELVKGMSKMMQLKGSVQAKNKLLQQVSDEGARGIVDISDLTSDWDAHFSRLQQFELNLEEQKKGLETQVMGQVEDFKGRIRAFGAKWEARRPRQTNDPNSLGDPATMLAGLEDVSARLAEVREEAARMEKDCTDIGLRRPDFEDLDRIGQEVEEARAAWGRLGAFKKELEEVTKREWVVTRNELFRLEDFLGSWRSQSGGKTPVDLAILIEVDKYQRVLPYLKHARGDGWEAKHWTQLFSLIGIPTKGPSAVDPQALTLAHFLRVADTLIQKADEVAALDALAQGESALRKAVNELDQWGYERQFSSYPYESQAGGQARSVPLIKDWKDILTEVGDYQALIGSLKQSPYFHVVKDAALGWEARLQVLSTALVDLNAVQRKWLYLEPIFGRGALPSEAQRFRSVDSEFVRLMADIHRQQTVKNFAEMRDVASRVRSMLEKLEYCQRALLAYLEEKRGLFPRFYFLGDDDLLEILGQSQNPEIILRHLKKLFAGIYSVKFSEDKRQITHMVSSDGEEVPLHRSVAVSDSVEAWLQQLAELMVESLERAAQRCLVPDGGGMKMAFAAEDYERLPSQVLNLAESVRFTAKVDRALSSSSPLGPVRQELAASLEQYTRANYEGLPVMMLKVKSLILDLIHFLDVLDHLEAERAQGPTDWAWTRQLRYYVGEGGRKCSVMMADAGLKYTFEYQGNAQKLVYTPLTDKCFLTLTQAMRLGYGGNPYGPAGTGKTESVKALGQYLARQVLVFNCDEEFDFQSMGRIFMGLVKCGAWGCFDEFNRLEEEVLSAVSQQIQIIQSALKEAKKSVFFLEREIEVNPNAGIFVTLNPAGKGYGGRSRLPDNLKQLFRPIAMTVPDNELIAEVLLLSEGFRSAKALGRKVVKLFEVCRQLLSRQQHYDWGLRALKTILGVVGRLLREARNGGGAAGGKEGEDMEAKVLLQAIRVTTLPKLTFEDTARFAGLLADEFPGLKVSDMSEVDVEKKVREVIKKRGLQELEHQVTKIMQLYVATMQRIGVIVVGPSGCGKSTLWGVLRDALAELGRPVRTHVMNPKAMDRKQLLGSMDLDTREWTDGVLTSAARRVVEEPPTQRSWVVCDGDVDPEWIESLNSVLDDNRLLTLPSGERIQFGNNVNFMFECHSLRFASPATVSRCAMIFLSEEDVDAGNLVKTWAAQLSPPEGSGAAPADQLRQWAGDFIEKCFDLALEHPPVVPTTKVGLLSAVWAHVERASSKAAFLQGLARALSANLDVEERGKFLSDMARTVNEVNLVNALTPDTSGHLVSSEDLFAAYEAGDGGGGAGGAGAFGARGGKGGAGAEAEGYLGADMRPRLVETGSYAAAIATLYPWMRAMEPVLLVGPLGGGKATLLEHVFPRLSGAVSVATVHCTSQTTARDVIAKLRQACGSPVSTAGGRVLRPRDADRLVLYLKDVNLPKPDKYGTMQVISLLQQLVTHHGYYDEREGLEFIGLERIQIVCSMNPPEAPGRQPLTSRFTAAVRVCHLPHPSNEELGSIFTRISRSAFVIAARAGGNASAAQLARSVQEDKLAALLVELYGEVRRRYSPNDQRHYLFSPRQLCEWVIGLTEYDYSTCDPQEAIANEARRIFSDRLVGSDAAATFEQALSSAVRTHLRLDLGRGGPAAKMFSAAAGVPAENSKGGVRPLVGVSVDQYRGVVSDALRGFEREVRHLGLLLFPGCLGLVSRLERVLRRPGGSLLLVGPPGAGRRSACSLAAYMLRMRLVTLNMGRGYGPRQFSAELKAVLTTAGVEGTPILLYLEDFQITHRAFLEAISSLLTSGEVPGLYTPEELDALLQPLEAQRAERGFQFATNFDFFVNRIRANLRVALAVDPAFAAGCEDTPALFTRASVQWVEGWGVDGAKAVVESRLSDIIAQLAADKKAGLRPGDLVDSIFAIHGSVPNASPRDLSVLVETYKSVLGSKSGEITEQMRHLALGTDKLREAATTVDELSKRAEEQRKLLSVKQREADEALVHISEAMKEAANRKREVETLTQRLAIEQGNIDQQKQGVELELAEVQPLIDQARAAVGQIRNEHLSEIKSLKVPPDPIRDVLEGVLKLMGQPDTSWNAMRTFLGKPMIKEQIINFDAHRVTPDQRRDVGRLLAQRGNSFEHDVISRVSKAAAPMAAWVRANLKFSEVLERIAPLENQLSTLTGNLDVARRALEENQAELAVLDRKTEALKADFARKTGEAEALKSSLRKAEETLTAATSLMSKLGGEKVRWETQLGQLRESYERMPVSALLASACLTFLPPEPEDRRRHYVSLWQAQIASTAGQGFDLRAFMATESEVLTWKAEGLAGDDVSVENAVCILHCPHRAPLIIDPSQQAAAWLATHIGKGARPVKGTTLHDPRFTNTLELAVRFGESLIVKEVDSVDPMLFPLLRRDLVRQGPREAVQIGDKVVDYDPNFRLYLVTRSEQTEVPAAARPLLTLANFTVTRGGLEAQLLALTIQKELPELETKKSALLRQGEELKVQLAALERDLLNTLAESRGNLLENRELVESLEKTKSNAGTIQESLKESLRTQEDLDRQRNVYRPVAQRGSALFFFVRDSFTLNPMYRFSLASFLRIFERTLADPSGGSAAETRIASLKSRLMENLVEHASRAMFNRDRLVLGMHLAHGLAADANRGTNSAPQSRPASFAGDAAPAAAGGPAISGREWEYLLGKLVVAPGGGGQRPSWVREDSVRGYETLVRGFPDIVSACNFSGAADAWAQWAVSGRPEAELPDGSARRLTPFQQLLVVTALRGDRAVTAMSQFACRALNVHSLAPPGLNLRLLYESESSAREPLLFVITPGSDPSVELREFAKTVVGEGGYEEVAMGQGQAEIALRLLRECARSGRWLCLKNLHLVTSWLPTLEKEVFGLTDPNPKFRLFLTSEQHPKFPDSLLEHCLKIAYEPPPGIRQNLQRTLESWGEAYFEQGKSATRCKLLFVLAWLYAVIQERRQYIPQGWSKFYEFGSSDLRSGADVIDIGTDKGKTPQFPYLHGLLETAILGGKVDNPYDTLVLRAYLETYFSREVTGVGAESRDMRKLPGTSVIVPSNAVFRDYLASIESLPESDSPGMFSLPANVNRALEQNASQQVLSALRAMESTLEAAEAGADVSSWGARLAPVFRAFEAALGGLSSASRGVLARGASMRASASGTGLSAAHRGSAPQLSPVQSMMASERGFGMRLLTTIQEALAGLQRVIKGQDTLGVAAQRLAQSLLRDEVPSAWDALWEGPDSAMDYLRAVAVKAAGVQKYDDLAAAGRLLAAPSLDLGEFFNPASFLSALKQETARELGVTMDSLVLVSAWDARLLSSAPRPITIGNLFISGASFDGKFLSDVAADSATFLPVPVATLAWVPKNNPHPHGPSCLELPLYVDRGRGKVLAALQLPLGDNEKKKWQLASVALFMSA